MELKLGSIWLLLSCSLQQSLWGILASVPHTAAKRCTQTVKIEGEEMKKVQIFKRIPSRCSSWDKAWSWITKVNCGTKYVWDYVELPSAVVIYKKQYVCCPDDTECIKAEAEASQSSDMNGTDEKLNFAIAFGSGAVALLIIVVVIIISLVRKRRYGSVCRQNTDYSSASGAERDQLEGNHACNEYVDEGLKLVESEYEEIQDPIATKRNPPPYGDESKTYPYENTTERKVPLMEEFGNGVAVVPSAPYEEELEESAIKQIECDSSCILPFSGSSVETEGHQKSAVIPDQPYENSAETAFIAGEERLCKRDSESKNDKKDKEESSERKKTENVYSKFDDLVNSREDSRAPDPLPVSHSYEHLDPNTLEPSSIPDYESLHTPSSESCDQPPRHSSNSLNTSASHELSLYQSGDTCFDKKESPQRETVQSEMC